MPALARSSSRGRGADVREALMKNLTTAIAWEAFFQRALADGYKTRDRAAFFTEVRKQVMRQKRNLDSNLAS
jgi:hypothetical protein